MKFTPQRYRIEDTPMQPFIDADEIWHFLRHADTSPTRIREIVAKSLSKERLNLSETAYQQQPSAPAQINEILEGARD